MPVSRAVLLGGIAAVLLGATFVGLFTLRRPSAETIFEPPSRILEAAAFTPWRNLDADAQYFFPGATRWESHTHVLSGVRHELETQLRRPPNPDDNLLQVHRVFQGAEEAGVVLAQRVPGQHGAIEIVVGIEPGGRISGVRLQRSREPATVSRAISNPAWLEAFKGKTAKDAFRPGEDLPAVTAEALGSARAIGEGVHSLLVLNRAAQRTRPQPRPHH